MQLNGMSYSVTFLQIIYDKVLASPQIQREKREERKQQVVLTGLIVLKPAIQRFQQLVSNIKSKPFVTQQQLFSDSPVSKQ